MAITNIDNAAEAMESFAKGSDFPALQNTATVHTQRCSARDVESTAMLLNETMRGKNVKSRGKEKKAKNAHADAAMNKIIAFMPLLLHISHDASISEEAQSFPQAAAFALMSVRKTVNADIQAFSVKPTAPDLEGSASKNVSTTGA